MAIQTVLKVHRTLASVLVVASVGLGVVWTCQVLPFQPSAKVTLL